MSQLVCNEKLNYALGVLKANLTYREEKLLEEYMDNLNEDESKVFIELADRFASYKKDYGHNSYRITKNAIKITLKIYENLEIKTFPLIKTVATKGWSLNNGTHAWMIYKLEDDLLNDIILTCDERVRECVKKKNIFVFLEKRVGCNSITLTTKEN